MCTDEPVGPPVPSPFGPVDNRGESVSSLGGLGGSAALLSEALSGIAGDFRKAMEPEAPRRPRFRPLEDVSRHLGIISGVLEGITPQLGKLTELLARRNETALAVGQAAGRFEQVLRPLLEGHHQAREAQADLADCEVQDLLVQVYRHHIHNIGSWLERLTIVIADPAAEAQAQGLPLESDLVLQVPLTFSEPPAMQALSEWAVKVREEAIEAEAALSEPSSPPPPEFEPAPATVGWSSALNALAVGILAARAGTKGLHHFRTHHL